MFGFWDPKRGKLQRLGAQFVGEKDGKVARRLLEQLSQTFLLPQLQSTLQRQGDDNRSTREAAQARLYQQLSALRIAVTQLLQQRGGMLAKLGRRQVRRRWCG